MQITLRHVRPVSVAFVRAFGPYDVSATAAWARLDAWLQRSNLRAQCQTGYGIMRDDPCHVGPFLRRYDACVPVVPGMVVDPAAEVGRQFLPGGVYAVGRFAGAQSDMPRALSNLHRLIVPKTGFSVDYGRPFVHTYTAAASGNPAATELCVPVKAMASFAGFEAREAAFDLAA